MISVDMRDAYFHVLVHQDSRKFIRFIFKNRVYHFRALCFGLATAPQFFTRVLTPIAECLCLLGVNISLYLDDWLLHSQSKEACTEDLQKTLLLAPELGLLINFQKSQLTPSQEIAYLGMRINSDFLGFSFPPKDRSLPLESGKIPLPSVLLCKHLDASSRDPLFCRAIRVSGKTVHEELSILSRSQLEQEEVSGHFCFPSNSGNQSQNRANGIST